MKKFKILIIVAITLFSCQPESDSVQFYFLVDSDKKAVNNSVIALLNDYKTKNGKVFIPGKKSKIIYKSKNDYNNLDIFNNSGLEDFFGFPFNSRKLEKELNRLKKESLPKYIDKYKQITKNDFDSYLKELEFDTVYTKFFEEIPDTKEINAIRDLLAGILDSISLAKNENKIVVFGIPNKRKTINPTPPDKGIDPDDPCQAKNNSSADELKKSLLEVIDVTKGLKERNILAKEVWNKYFTTDAYVNRFTVHPSKSPQYYGFNGVKGDIGGEYYFTEVLATRNSIKDLNITRVEYSIKEIEKGKLTGIHIVECHNKNK
jgi:hypothetical protein